MFNFMKNIIFYVEGEKLAILINVIKKFNLPIRNVCINPKHNSGKKCDDNETRGLLDYSFK